VGSGDAVVPLACPNSRDGSTNSDSGGAARGARVRALDGSVRDTMRTVYGVGSGCVPARVARGYVVGSCRQWRRPSRGGCGVRSVTPGPGPAPQSAPQVVRASHIPRHGPKTIAVLVQRGAPRDVSQRKQPQQRSIHAPLEPRWASWPTLEGFGALSAVQWTPSRGTRAMGTVAHHAIGVKGGAAAVPLLSSPAGKVSPPALVRAPA